MLRVPLWWALSSHLDSLYNPVFMWHKDAFLLLSDLFISAYNQEYRDDYPLWSFLHYAIILWINHWAPRLRGSHILYRCKQRANVTDHLALSLYRNHLVESLFQCMLLAPGHTMFVQLSFNYLLHLHVKCNLIYIQPFRNTSNMDALLFLNSSAWYHFVYDYFPRWRHKNKILIEVE